jgi:hypothetical protein
MLDINEYRLMFADKLKETGSFDDAFRKVIHRSYQHGVKDADGVVIYTNGKEDSFISKVIPPSILIEHSLYLPLREHD